MADLNWCTFCDNAVSPFSESLYCSEQCLRADALRNHPLLGYTYPEFTDFPRANKPTVVAATNHQHQTLRQQQQSSPKLSYSNLSSPALTATSFQSKSSASSRSSTCESLQFSSPPKLDLLPSHKPNNTNNNFNYYLSMFSS